MMTNASLQLRWALVVDKMTGKRSVRFYRLPIKYDESTAIERVQTSHPYLVVFRMGTGYCPAFIRDEFMSESSQVAV